MKKTALSILAGAALLLPPCLCAVAASATVAATEAAASKASKAKDPNRDGRTYTPSEAVKKSQADFAADRFGIFIHWGIYSMFGQGEWYLNYGPLAEEYAKAAGAFYPAGFDAGEWADAFRDSGARYVCFTTRHHDGFSMFHTKQSPYNIVDATPFGRDVLKELSDSLRSRDLDLHLYYSHIDWTRRDYPRGRTGLKTYRDSVAPDWPGYYRFMNAQLRELLTGYGPIRAIWFDGKWDHDQDSIPFDWQLGEQYDMIHRLQPGCLIGNNHHEDVIPGEDIQIFERDVPGENTAGYSEQAISRIPLETCQTMNGMWGYKVVDTDYKDARTLIRYLVKTSGVGANLLLNIGPQPDGRLPEAARERLKAMGEWLAKNGETIYGTEAGPVAPTEWGATTRKGDRVFVHIFPSENNPEEIVLPFMGKIKSARVYGSGEKVRWTRTRGGVTLYPGKLPDCDDYIVEIRN